MPEKYRIIHPGRIATPIGPDLASEEAIVARLNEMHATIDRIKAVPELQIGIDHECNEFGCSFGTMDIRDGSCRYDLTHVRAIKGGYIWKPDLDAALSERES